MISLVLCSVGCDSNDNGGIDPGVNPLIGTWDLTLGAGTYLGASVSFPPSYVGLFMTVDLMSDATYEVTIMMDDEQTIETGFWQSNETTITLTASTGDVATWPYEVNGNTFTATVDTDVFDFGIPGATGDWTLTFTKQ